MILLSNFIFCHKLFKEKHFKSYTDWFTCLHIKSKLVSRYHAKYNTSLIAVWSHPHHNTFLFEMTLSTIGKIHINPPNHENVTITWVMRQT